MSNYILVYIKKKLSKETAYLAKYFNAIAIFSSTPQELFTQVSHIISTSKPGHFPRPWRDRE